MSSHNKPAYRLIVAGKDISDTVEARLISLSLTDNRGFEADQLDITLDDHDGALAIPRRGAEIRLWLGWAGEGLVDKGSFKVDETEHAGTPDTLTIRARSADVSDKLGQKKSRSWHKKTVGQIVTTIAKAHGLMPQIGPAITGRQISHIDQTDESDANFLTRLGQRYDCIATVKNGRLLFAPAGQATSTSGKPLPAVTLQREDGDQHRYSLADRDSYSGVKAYWNSRKHAKRHEVKVGSGDNLKALRTTYHNEDEARRAAKAELARLQRGSATFSLTLARGRADLIPELPVTASGWKPEIDGTAWLIAKLSHNVASGGFTTAIEMEVKGEGKTSQT